MAETLAVIDFETTGLGAGSGGRATEIAAVLVRDGRIVDQYQSLMRSGVSVPPFIERLTGISNAMLADAPPAAQVMQDVFAFTRGCGLVAHNASFDRSFWHYEADLAGCEPDPAHEFACTVLLARRLYPEAPSCKLGALAQFHALPNMGRAHRALADAMTTAHLLLRMQADVSERYAAALAGAQVNHGLLALLQRCSRTQLLRAVTAEARRQQARAQMPLFHQNAEM